MTLLLSSAVAKKTERLLLGSFFEVCDNIECVGNPLEILKFVNKLVICAIIIVMGAGCDVFVVFCDRRNELTTVYIPAEGSQALFLRMARRSASLLFTHDTRGVLADLKTSTLTPVVAVNKVSIYSHGIFCSRLDRKQRVKVRNKTLDGCRGLKIRQFTPFYVFHRKFRDHRTAFLEMLEDFESMRDGCLRRINIAKH